MSEALEYRVKKNRIISMIVPSYVAFLLGYVLTYTMGEYYYSVMFFAALVFLGACWWASMRSGRIRRFFETCFGEFSDPPLNEWREELKARGAFARQQREQAIADGGDDERC